MLPLGKGKVKENICLILFGFSDSTSHQKGGWQYMVYNQLDQVVMSQDANQQLNHQWTVAKYDRTARVIMTGLWNDPNAVPLTISALQTNVDNSTQWDTPDYAKNNVSYPYGYVINSYPALSKMLIVNYYDNYDNIPELPGPFNQSSNYSQMTRGALTASKTAVLNSLNNDSPDMLWAAHYYDDLGRMVAVYNQHYLGGVLNSGNYDKVIDTYDFANEITGIARYHYNSTNASSPVLTVANAYTYDHEGRKKQTREQINGDANVLLSDNEYNEIGQLVVKNLHGINGGAEDIPANVSLGTADAVASGQTKTVIASNSITINPGFTAATGSTFIARIAGYLQAVNYTYNERGWLTQSSAGLFEEQLQYNKVGGINSITPTPQYNGDIASQSWGTSAAPDSKSYTYTYDNLNRLTAGIATDNFSESGITYDMMGNITALNRYHGSSTPIDQLSYTYNNTNQVQSITDGATDNSVYGYRPGLYSNYKYDPNGNMSVMPTPPNGQPVADINIQYNLLNLPQNITAGKTITYFYDAGGNKLRRVSPNTGSTDYIGGIQYDQSVGATLPTISFIQTEEGKAVPIGGVYNYTYYLSDRLGNTRVAFETKTGAAVMSQQDDYYPFGYEISRGTVTNPKNEYLYNGKELQEELGVYDYGRRMYDPVIARWTAIDPKTEAYPNWSGYNYALNNPVKYIDPNGEDVYLTIWGTHDGNIGHAGIAVDNYRTEEVKDKHGNTKLDKNGNPITKQVKTGTVTYYDLWPGGDGAGKSNFDKDIPAAYGGTVTTVDALKNSDVSGSEGRAADGVIKFSTNASTDALVVDGLNAFKDANSSYNGLRCNCSDFAKEGVLYAAPPGTPLTNYREQIGSTNATTPNQLWKAASQLKNATVIKDPGTKVQKTFIEGVTGGEVRQKVAEKRVN